MSTTMGFNEMKQLEEWTKMKIGNIIFDSNIDDWKENTSVLGQRIMNKSNLIFLIEDDDGNKFGGFINVIINRVDRWINDPNAFLFSIKSNVINKYEIKELRHAFVVHMRSSYFLFSFGYSDICICKENNKNKSYCNQQTYNYNGIENALCGKSGPTNPFEPKKIKVIEMK